MVQKCAQQYFKRKKPMPLFPETYTHYCLKFETTWNKQKQKQQQSEENYKTERSYWIDKLVLSTVYMYTVTPKYKLKFVLAIPKESICRFSMCSI